MALICKTNLGRRKKLPVLNELKKDVLNNTKSKTIYKENHQIYQLSYGKERVCYHVTAENRSQL